MNFTPIVADAPAMALTDRRALETVDHKGEGGFNPSFSTSSLHPGTESKLNQTVKKLTVFSRTIEFVIAF
jgi:hypothetical protein